MDRSAEVQVDQLAAAQVVAVQVEAGAQAVAVQVEAGVQADRRDVKLSFMSRIPERILVFKEPEKQILL